MTKFDFLNRLNALTVHLPESERERLKSYFTEMIDDRVEMGMDEETAVEALGSPEALLKDIAPAGALQPISGTDDTCSGDIREIHIHMKNADAAIRRGPLPDNVSAQLRPSELNRFTWSLKDGVLTVSETGEVRRGLFHRDAEMTLILSNYVPEKLIADSYGGDLGIINVEVKDMAVLASSSGDIALRHFSCGGRIEVTSRSGDIRLEDSAIQGDCKLESMSGDVKLRQLQAASLRVRTASGDAECAGLRANTAAIGAVSGDIGLTDAVAATSLICEATSGDVELTRAIAPDTRLSTASGDITLLLPQVDGGVDVRADTRSGDIKVPFNPSGNARYAILARSVSGDIEVTAP